MDEQAPSPTAGFMTMMRGMTDENGMTPDEFASLVFASIKRGEYWIIPQPEALDSALQDRTEMILDRRPPTNFNFTSGDGE